MNLTIEKREDCVLARVQEPRFDAVAAPDFKNRMSGVLSGGQQRVVLDLSPVQFIDSSAIAALLSVVKSVPQGSDLRLCGAQEQVRSVFRLTRLDKVIPLYETEEEALVSFPVR